MRARDTWVLVATIAASSMAFIDGMVVTLALPSIQHSFRADAASVAWIVELYTLVVGSLMLIGGALGDAYGRKRIFVLGVAIFVAGSIGCAFAWSIPTMLMMRVVQGIGGMLVIPASLALVGAHFSGSARDRAIALWSAFGALTSTLAPMFGGIAIDALGWRSVFWINVPIAAVVLYASLRHVDESRDEGASQRLDFFGAALIAAGLGSLTYALIRASSSGWHDLATLGDASTGLAIIALFIFRDARTASPLVPPSIFASRNFTSINITTLALYAALGGIFYELPFVMIQAHGYTALQTALATLPIAACMILLARPATGLARRTGIRFALTLGPAVAAAGFFLLAVLEPHRGYAIAFFPGLTVIGIGLGLTVAPLTSAVISTVGENHIGIASGVNNAVSRIAGLLAIAALTTLLVAAYGASIDRSLSAMHATRQQRREVNAQRQRLGGARFNDPSLQAASVRAFEAAFAASAIACAILAAMASATSWIGIRDEDAAKRA